MTLLILGLAVPGDVNMPDRIDVAAHSPLTWSPWLVLGALTLVLMLLERWLLAPLRRLRTCAEQLAAGRYDSVSGVGGIGAVADLAATLDRLSQQLRAQDSLQATDTQLVVVERKQVERALSYLEALDTVLVEASRTLLTAQPEALDHVVIRVLGAVARRMDVERACLYQVSNDSQQLTATHEWCAMNVAERRVTADPIPLTSLPRWMDTCTMGKMSPSVISTCCRTLGRWIAESCWCWVSARSWQSRYASAAGWPAASSRKWRAHREPGRIPKSASCACWRI
jgi:nitrate/nitrite-specific signal transduction histidine kinase